MLVNNKILIIGFGSIAKKHIRIINYLLPKAEVAILRVKSNKKVNNFKTFFNLKEAKDFNPRIVFICSAANKHIYYFSQFRNITKNIFIEKPLSDNFNSVKKIDVFQKNNFQVGYFLRFHSILIQLHKIIIGKTTSVLIKDTPITTETSQLILELREQQDATTFKTDRDFINERIASLAGAIGCIYVGGNSDVEQKEKFDRVDDSVCAVRSALQEGIVTGGGLALYKSVEDFKDYFDPNKWDNKEVAKSILGDAAQIPFRQIIINAGKNPDDIIVLMKDNNSVFGYDVKNEKMGDMFKMGVIDPLKVTKNALVNAVSVATTILSTNAIVTHARANN